MDRGGWLSLVVGIALAVALMAAPFLFPNMPSRIAAPLFYGGIAIAVICIILLLREGRRKRMSDRDKQDGPPRPPKGQKVGLWFGPKTKNKTVIGNRFEGFDIGVHDEGESGFYRANEFKGPREKAVRPPEAAPQERPDKPRKFFGGFSFSKGDHLKK